MTAQLDDGASVAADVDPVDDDFNLREWIESGTTATRKVVIYNDPALAEQYQALADRLEKVDEKRKTAGGDEAMGAPDEAEEIIAAMEDLYEQFQASKATWTVRGLTQDEVSVIVEAHPNPDKPAEPVAPQRPSRSAQPSTMAKYETDRRHHQGEMAKYNNVVREWLKACGVAETRRNLAYIATAVVSVETPRGTVSKVSVADLDAMRARVHGVVRINHLLNAVNAATEGEVDVPRPPSRAPLKTTLQ